MTLRFGVIVGQARPYATLVDDWLLVERLGFDNAWLIDHFSPDFAPDAPLLESWTALAALAARTNRIRLGTAVTNAAVRNPAVLCKQAITLDQISGGRLDMAIGAGYYEREHRMLGIDYLDARGRGERLREAVQVLDRGLRGERVSLDGKSWRLDGLPMLPGPVQRPRPPLWVAAQQPFSLRTAALHADVLVTMGSEGDSREATLSKVRARFDRFREICDELGRAPSRRAYLVGFSDDRAFESENSFAQLVATYAQVGVTDFIFGFTSQSGNPDLADRNALERTARSLATLRSLPAGR